MSKKQKDQTVTINDKDYNVEDLSQEQVTLVNHVADLDRKISSSQFNLDQLGVGRNAFMTMLSEALEVKESQVIDAALA